MLAGLSAGHGDLTKNLRLRAAVSAQVFVRLHVEPHGEKRELRPGDEQKRYQDDGADADLVAADPVDELEHAEDEAREHGEEAERIEEDERMEVADDVLLAQSPEEAAQQQPGDARHDPVVAEGGALSDAVHGTGRKVADSCIPDVEVHEQVVGESVSRIHVLEIELRE